MVFLCGPLRISAISALKRPFQRRDRRDTQRTAEKDSKLARRLQLFVQAAISLEVRVVKNFAVVVIKVIITPLI